jgi:hypothetical protein
MMPMEKRIGAPPRAAWIPSMAAMCEKALATCGSRSARWQVDGCDSSC